jgi:putative peptidoglycan lipid II flippase
MFRKYRSIPTTRPPSPRRRADGFPVLRRLFGSAQAGRSIARVFLKSRLVHGGLIVGAGILLGNVTGFFRVAVTAWLLGTHSRADVLAVAMGPLDTLNSVIVNTMLFAFVPMLLVRHEGDRAAVFAGSARVFGSIVLGLSVLVAVFAPQLIPIFGPGLAAPDRARAAMLLRLFAPATFFSGCGAIFSALLYTDRRFLVPGLYQTCLNGGIIAGALLLRNTLGINGFAIGYTAGTALQLVLAWFFSRDLRHAPRSSLRLSLSDVLVRPGMFVLYASLIAGNLVVTRSFATRAGPGMAAAFDYSTRCTSVVLAYLVYPVASTLVPEIARLRGTNDTRKAYSLIDRGVGLMALAAITSCALGVFLRTPVIALLFERGSFTAESTQLVSAVFLGFAPSIVGWALLDLIARCFFALDRWRLPLIAAFVPISLNVAITSFLHASGRLKDPALLGLGASVGLLSGFAALFVMIHIRRNAAKLEPSLVEAG